MGRDESSAASFLEARLELARLDVDDVSRLDRILEHATRISAEQLEVERAGIWMFDSERTALVECLVYNRSTRAHARPGTKIALASVPKYAAALEEMRALVFEDARSHPATLPLLETYLDPLGIGSLLDTPVFRRGKLFGIVCHEHVGARRSWGPREIDFAVSVADMVALYFEEAEAALAQKRLLMQEKELLQAERHASVGILARHVAHDLNNAVAPILMCASQLKNALASDPKMSERVTIILDAAGHCGAIARRLLSASAGAPASSRATLDLKAFLDESAPLLRAIAGDDHELVIESNVERCSVRADGIELMRALINLVTNARDAMPEGGTITVEATRGEHDEVRLAVSDRGDGMSEAETSLIFEPFYTTKPGRGTGLGLAGVKSIVEALRGRVDVESRLGEGTRVTMTIPSASEAPGE